MKLTFCLLSAISLLAQAQDYKKSLAPPPPPAPVVIPHTLPLTPDEQKDLRIILSQIQSLQLQEEILRRTACMRMGMNNQECGRLDPMNASVEIIPKPEPPTATSKQ